MNAKRSADGRIWLLAILGALVVLIPLLALFRMAQPVSGQGKTSLSPPTIRLTVDGADSDASLFDPRPLFLPTKWNARSNVLPAAAMREPGDGFRFPESWNFAEDSAVLTFPPPVQIPEKPADVLALEPVEAPFFGFGRTDRQVPELEHRDGFVEVVAAGDGRAVLQRALHDIHPPGDSNWEPLEFIAAVEAAGLVGSPTLVTSSKVQAVDVFFENYLVKGLRIGERLGPGTYRIKIGP
jgi:hypothetical protein